MSRLIDADALRELFAETISAIAKRPEMDGNLEYMIRSSAMAIKMIDDQPTVDDVVHGHWKHIFGGFVECSNCGVFPLLDGERKYVESDFCPCCGALMDEVEE